MKSLKNDYYEGERQCFNKLCQSIWSIPVCSKYLQNKDMKKFQEVQCCINNLINHELPKVENYCKQNVDEDGLESLLEIARADCKSMHMIFKNLRLP